MTPHEQQKRIIVATDNFARAFALLLSGLKLDLIMECGLKSRESDEVIVQAVESLAKTADDLRAKIESTNYGDPNP